MLFYGKKNRNSVCFVKRTGKVSVMGKNGGYLLLWAGNSRHGPGLGLSHAETCRGISRTRHVIQPRVRAIHVHQLFMRSLFLDSLIGENQDTLRIPYCG